MGRAISGRAGRGLGRDERVWSNSANGSNGGRAGGYLARNTAMVNPIPEGYRSVNVILTVDDAARAIDFYKKAFGARKSRRLPMGDKIGHAELQIGDTRIMLNDEFPEYGNLGPKARGGTSVELIIYTDDVDSAFQEGNTTPAGPRRCRSRTSSGATGWAV